MAENSRSKAIPHSTLAFPDLKGEQAWPALNLLQSSISTPSDRNFFANESLRFSALAAVSMAA